MTKKTPKRLLGKAHREVLGIRDGYISKQAIKRLARRSGVKRMTGTVHEEARSALRTFLEDILHDVVIIVEHAKRHTVTITDILLALKRRGRPLYGFGPIAPPAWAVRKPACKRKALSECCQASSSSAVQAVEAPSTPVSCALAAPLLEPDTCSAGDSLSEEHAWKIREALGAFSVSPECQNLMVACKINDVHRRLTPYLCAKDTSCSVAQLRRVAEQLGDDDSVEVYFDKDEDRLILN